MSDRSAPGQLLAVLQQIAEMISVVLIGLPDGGVRDVVDHFMKNSSLARSSELSPRKRVDEMSSDFPLDFPPLTRLLSRQC